MKQSVHERIGWALVFFGVLSLIIISVFFFLGTRLVYSGENIDSELIGGMGSFVSGYVGIYFSMAAVIFFVVALNSQKDELKLQREELKETRATFRLQQFESAFFNLLSTQQSIREFIQNRDRGTFVDLDRELGDELDKKKGSWFEHRFMEYKLGVIFNEIKADTLSDFVKLAYQFDLQKILDKPQKTVYDKFLEEHSSELNHYMNNLFIIVKYLRDSEAMVTTININCRDYFNYIIAPMSRSELYLVGQHAEAYQSLREMLDYFEWKNCFDEETGLMI